MTTEKMYAILISVVKCGCSLVVKFKLPKLASRVRFPSPALLLIISVSSHCILKLLERMVRWSSWFRTPACHAGDHEFESRTDRHKRHSLMNDVFLCFQNINCLTRSPKEVRTVISK